MSQERPTVVGLIREKLAQNGVFRTEEIIEATGTKAGSVHGAVSHLRKSGLRIGNDNGRYYLEPGEQKIEEQSRPYQRRRSTKDLIVDGAVPPLGLRLQVVALAMDGRSRVAVTMADPNGRAWTMSLTPKPDWVED